MVCVAFSLILKDQLLPFKSSVLNDIEAAAKEVKYNG